MSDCDANLILDDLLIDWELAQEAGVPISSETLCRDHPELLSMLNDRIEKLRSSSWMLRDAAQDEFEATQRHDCTVDAREDQTAVDFVDALSRSGVLSEEQIAAIMQRVAVESPRDASELAQRLVADGLLTSYQSDVLLEGSKSPLLLDRYVILDALGAGGMGLVFKALHRSMERIVAIKVLPPYAVDSPDKVLRFQREVKSAAKLNHPNVVSALDAYERNGTYFLVMEYVDGENLTETISRHGVVASDQAVEIIDQVAAGLAEAHRAGIVHRDVKPSNIMLDFNGTAKLLDLGLARVMQGVGRDPDHEITRDALAMGTAAYMSPEQALDAAKADERSDIYSLGCTLYYLIHGRGPFDRPTTVQTIVAHRESLPPKLLDSDERGVPKLEHVFQRMLAKDADERYQSIDELRADLAGDVATVSTRKPNSSISTEGRQATLVATAPSATLSRKNLLIGACLVTLAIASISIWMAISNRSSNGIDDDAVHRDVAKWAITSGGIVTAETELGEQVLMEASEIPESSFRIVELDLYDLGDGLSIHPVTKISTLRSLTLNDFSSVNLTSLATLPDLKTLSLIGCSGDSSFAKLPHLNDLSIYDAAFAETDLKRLSEMSDLTVLDLTGATVPEAGWPYLARMRRVEKLYLMESNAQSTDLQHCPESLRELSLAWCDLDDQVIDNLSHLLRLESINFNGTSLAAETISGLSRFPRLRRLDLSEIKLTPEAIGSLKEIGGLSHLTLIGNRISDKHADALAQLPAIESLDLSDARIGDEGFLKLVAIKPLRELWISGTRISQSAIDRFLQQRDDVTLLESVEQ